MPSYSEELMFQFYDSTIKRAKGPCPICDAMKFQFYDSTIKSTSLS